MSQTIRVRVYVTDINQHAPELVAFLDAVKSAGAGVAWSTGVTEQLQQRVMTDPRQRYEFVAEWPKNRTALTEALRALRQAQVAQVHSD